MDGVQFPRAEARSRHSSAALSHFSLTWPFPLYSPRFSLKEETPRGLFEERIGVVVPRLSLPPFKLSSFTSLICPTALLFFMLDPCIYRLSPFPF